MNVVMRNISQWDIAVGLEHAKQMILGFVHLVAAVDCVKIRCTTCCVLLHQKT